VSLSFTVATTAADRAAAELLAVPVGKGSIAKGAELGPGADAVDAALDGGLAAFLAEAGFDGKLGETLAGCARRPRCWSASVTPPSSPSTACAAPPRRWRVGRAR
jgi:hypothetical protein